MYRFKPKPMIDQLAAKLCMSDTIPKPINYAYFLLFFELKVITDDFYASYRYCVNKKEEYKAQETKAYDKLFEKCKPHVI